VDAPKLTRNHRGAVRPRGLRRRRKLRNRKPGKRGRL
jgi:hypothetical protein